MPLTLKEAKIAEKVLVSLFYFCMQHGSLFMKHLIYLTNNYNLKYDWGIYEKRNYAKSVISFFTSINLLFSISVHGCLEISSVHRP